MNHLSCRIADTTPQQRRSIIESALGLVMLDALPPTDDVMELARLYIDGRLELDDIEAQIMDRYKKAYAG